MTYQLIDHSDSSRLILIFAGWGMDATPFLALRKPGYSIAVVWDYTDLSLPTSWLEGFDEIVVIGWSMGVYYADCFMSDNPQLPITRRIAVNGTLQPLDAQRGIDPDLFLRTADGVATGFVKFYRRVCGGGKGLARFLPELPRRDAEQMRHELLAIAAYAAQHPIDDTSKWDEIVISDNDLIFPPAAMARSWQGSRGRIIHLPEGSHFIDFAKLIAQRVIDKQLVGERFAAASSSYNSNADVQRSVAGRLVEMARQTLAGIDCANRRLLEIGSGCGMLTELYASMFVDSDIDAWDLSTSTQVDVASNRLHSCQCDAETAINNVADSSYDFIFSSSTLQWLNSPTVFIERLYRVLAPGGYAFISCFGPGTFANFEGSSSFEGLSYPQFSTEFLSGVGFNATIHSQSYKTEFDSAADALRHLRQTGVNSVSRQPMGAAGMRALMRSLSDDNDHATLTFNTNFYILHKPMDKETIFVSGIDTDAGKSYATGWLAVQLTKQGRTVRTQKFIQTGNVGQSEDIEVHRRIQGLPIDNEPWQDTAPEIYSYPASPHLSAIIDKRPVDLAKIDAARQRLEQTCDTLLVEGAGGLMVPLDQDVLTIDYILSRRLSVALVTNGRLGSINHTLLALEAIKTRGLKLRYLLYNTHFDKDKIIADDAREYIRRRVARDFPDAEFLEVPSL
jgi:dethiobiotin synthetase